MSTIPILADFRSDTVTKPSPAMIHAMSISPVGDDVFQEDPTINLLESRVSALTGKQSAMFCISGTMSNQLAIRTHLHQPPYSVVCDRKAHVNVYEAGGIAFHNGAQTITVDPEPGLSYLTSEVVKKALILDDDYHHAPTRLVCLENTMNGLIFPIEEQRKISQMVKSNGISMHLDGARIWNAKVATGLTIEDLCSPYDTVSLCFSKGLGTPVGSVLVGPSKFIKKARHFRKLYGGGIRQGGGLAGACLFALEEVGRLEEDHVRARRLADELCKVGFKLSRACETSMVWLDTRGTGRDAEFFRVVLAKAGIIVFGGDGWEMRLVVHRDIGDEAVDVTIRVLKDAVATIKE